MNRSAAPKTIVIGAGMGGLSAALDLAAGGAAVSLFEAQAQPGGKMREVTVAGREIDSGPTVFTMRWVFEELFAAAGQNFGDHVSLSRNELLARHSWTDRSTLDLYADVERSVAAISDFSGPEEGRGYRRFAERSQAIFETLDHSFMRVEKPNALGLSRSLGLGGIPRLMATKPFTSLWKELGHYFKDPRLQQLFARYATYCGSSPFAAPATLMLIAHAERAGVWLVDGGMQRLAEAMAQVAERSGAELNFGCGVRQINTQDNAVTGVTLEDGRVVPADAVVFNGDIAALSAGLLGDGVRRAVPERSAEPRSLSALTFSLCGRPEGFDLAHHTVFFGKDYPAEFSSIFQHSRVTEQPTVYVCAQDRGHGRAAQNGTEERLFLLVNAPAGPMSDAVIKRVKEQVMAQLHNQGLSIDGLAEEPRIHTPNDFAARFPGSEGAIYGWPTHGWSGSFRRHGSRAAIRGLYLAGGSVHPGPGVPMATISGRLAAAGIRKDLGD